MGRRFYLLAYLGTSETSELMRMKTILKILIDKLPLNYVEFLKRFSIRLLTYLSKLNTTLPRDPYVTEDENRNLTKENVTNFALDHNSTFEILGNVTSESKPTTWGHSDCTYNKYIGVILRNNEILKIRKPFTFRNTWVRLSFAPAFQGKTEIRGNLALRLTNFENEVTELACFSIQNTKCNSEWSTFEIDLQRFDGENGHLEVSFKSDHSQLLNIDPFAPDFPIIVSKFSVGPKPQLNLIEARTFSSTRIQNEVGHFSEVYKHKMYESAEYVAQPISIMRLEDIESNISIPGTPPFESSRPVQGESVYAYASRLLDLNLEFKSIDFEERILDLCKRKAPLRVLSLCSGSARTEARFDEVTEHACVWTLQDLNEELLNRAHRQFSPSSAVEFMVGDVNKIAQTDKKWDIIMCVSGLHHVVELEIVLNFIAQSLTLDGEFWLIGEYVGKSGNRLHPAAQVEADKIFHELPPKYRFNHHLNKVDEFLPRNDYSIDCFEGIRADEIEALISSQFYPKEIARNNAFLWRLINLAYADNYKLEETADLLVIESLVRAELDHFQRHHDGTSLNAIYKKMYRS